MKRRNQKKGYVYETSLPSKLLTLKPGETLYLNDSREINKKTMLERQVHIAMLKSEALKGRRFVTERCIAVQTSPVAATPILAIHRRDVLPPE
ncbi:hypothetical protein [Shinella sp.]|uniref:hypothetical protein n=1 Tax=Shinella sp. TaxID=1870904 RepID=UPI002587BF6A|nr:hypothetical protein [Shinella sp.]MCW5706965.1 hypothetical protein [Shinella sp.]